MKLCINFIVVITFVSYIPSHSDLANMYADDNLILLLLYYQRRREGGSKGSDEPSFQTRF